MQQVGKIKAKGCMWTIYYRVPAEGKYRFQNCTVTKKYRFWSKIYVDPYKILQNKLLSH